MGKKKSAFDILPKKPKVPNNQTVGTSKAPLTALDEIKKLKAGARFCSIKNPEIQIHLISEHFDDLNEDAKFDALFINDKKIRTLVLLAFAKEQLHTILTGRKIFDLYRQSNLLCVLRHPDIKVQNTFMSFYAHVNVEHPKWKSFQNQDLSRFLTHDHTQVRKIVAQIMDLKFITQEMIDRGLSDSSEIVQAVWASRKSEFEHNKLTHKFLSRSDLLSNIPPAL